MAIVGSFIAFHSYLEILSTKCVYISSCKALHSHILAFCFVDWYQLFCSVVHRKDIYTTLTDFQGGNVSVPIHVYYCYCIMYRYCQTWMENYWCVHCSIFMLLKPKQSLVPLHLCYHMSIHACIYMCTQRCIHMCELLWICTLRVYWLACTTVVLWYV